MRLTNRHLAALTALFALAVWGSIAMSGCFDYNPLDPPTRAEVAGITVSERQHQDYQLHALLLYQSRVEDYYGVDLGNEWEHAGVYWVEEVCGDEGNPGVSWNDTCYSGLMFSCDEMYVATDFTGICKTALLHEFTHCLSYLVHGTYSGDHEGDIWELERVVNAEICGRGW